VIDTKELGLETLSSGSLRGLVAELDALFPDVYPDYLTDPRELAYKAGQLSIVRLLKAKLDND
jgi:hypothetical protein|tara:strand:- start:83 stop:271 length:189 start_codon:yes stop_codon:yes gene_type:complete